TVFEENDRTLCSAISPERIILSSHLTTVDAVTCGSTKLAETSQKPSKAWITHGKTTISTLLSFLLHKSGFNNSAFLGGISNNFESNYLVGDSDWLVAEADEFDRSFLHLNPYAAIITAIDADHLDIYKDKKDIEATFNQLVQQVQPGGILIYKKGLPLIIPGGIKAYTYSLNENNADFYASQIENINGNYNFTLNTPQGRIENLTTRHPGLINVENSIAALALATLIEADEEPLRNALAQFMGIKRRFDVQLQTDKLVYIDDYAHHPRELDAVIGSVKDMYPGKKVTGIFQPHLFSRTRDFADEFAKSLSQLDELYLLDIYPARELPIPGVTSDIIFKDVTISNKHNCSKENLLEHLKEQYIEVLLTLGAGDIDCLVEPIKELVNTK
ncbi:MAG: UDP-N-acetylmuramate--L-alanine ligase, partial [Bacteroidales bacterium]|nr:UDP-N-acetylmuramate--L-alanine ligase [Bacteroidales bacterium]